ncbi:MAG TPA: putative transporter, partial [Bacteroidales bacterium]|nr:putative transporter [Bacteroidales bacterium]
MEWFGDLVWNDSVAHTVLLYCVIIILGVFLGKRKIFGISLGITFVLFAGIAIGHLGFTANKYVVDFLRDFGLILFVFFIGLQVGPAFFSSFRKGGLSLNIIALIIVILGAVTTITIHFVTGTSMPMLAGIMSGAVTNTPGLGAAQTALSQMMEKIPGAEIPEISLGYAIAYPFGILGVILSMIFIKRIFRIDLAKEIAAFEEELHPSDTLPEKASILVRNPDLFNRSILEISKSLKPGVVISRILHNGNLHAATSETIIHENDIVLVVAQRSLLEEIIGTFGTLSSMDLASDPGQLISRRILVTNGDVVGRSLGSLKLRTLYNINITRIHRSDIEIIASPGLRIQMGDRLTVVGEEKSVMLVADQLGNSLKRLKEPNVIALFTGILMGVILGSIPFNIPGVSHPIRLGLAGGPLIVAILMSRFGYKISLISY